MANKKVKSSQKGKENDGVPQRLIWLPNLKEGTPKKAVSVCR